MTMTTRIALLPRPDPFEFPVGLPPATAPHHCPPFCWPLALCKDDNGLVWAEWECQVCGAGFNVPAALEDFGLTETAPVAVEAGW